MNLHGKISDLENITIDVDGKKFVPFENVVSILNYIGETSINWTVEEFEYKAIALEEFEQDGDEKPVLYDRTKFENALFRMIEKHDCNNGITWDTIECYLNVYCKIIIN
jgi:hypothetical protein